MNELLGLIRSIGVARLGAIIGVTAGVAIALALIIARIGEPPMTILYADLEMGDAQRVIERLNQDGVRNEIRERGGRVSVLAPASETPRLKMTLAAEGVVTQSGVGYEIFDKSDSFGSTSFQQNISRLRALEGELARTVSSIAGVRSARVHLVLPERELFAREKKTASASIVVETPNGLDKRSVRAIVNLAASAVPDLSPARVTVLDSAGVLLASGRAGDDEGALAGNVEERIIATETRIRRTLEDIVGRIVGEENLRVQVSADLDFSRITESAEIIDPDSQTVLSSTSVEEASDTIDPAIGRGVTIANALPGAQQIDPAAAASTATNRRTEETTNYEISRTVRNEVREQGGIKRLSVAVAINAMTTTAATGETVPAPRAPAELAQISALVKSAIGYNEARGDQVEVVEIPFSATSASISGAPAADPAGMSVEQQLRIAELAALGLIALALVYYVLRPLFSSAKVKAAIASAAASSALEQSAEKTALPAPRENALDQHIDLARVEGQVKASSLKKVVEVVKGHTDESAGILKSWIREAS